MQIFVEQNRIFYSRMWIMSNIYALSIVIEKKWFSHSKDIIIASFERSFFYIHSVYGTIDFTHLCIVLITIFRIMYTYIWYVMVFVSWPLCIWCLNIMCLSFSLHFLPIALYAIFFYFHFCHKGQKDRNDYFI